MVITAKPHLTWQQYFRPSVVRAGESLFLGHGVTISHVSHVKAQIYVKSTMSYHVLMTKTEFHSIEAQCTCSVSARGQLCKHIWASLLALEKKHRDFVEGVTRFEKPVGVDNTASSVLKARQAHFRKLRYQQQKQKIQKIKSRKRSRHLPDVSEDVANALSYFAENGFPLEDLKDENTLSTAKKNLARVFHPDVGGSHEETVRLNMHFQTLARHMKASR